jgi:hypothetical protein
MTRRYGGHFLVGGPTILVIRCLNRYDGLLNRKGSTSGIGPVLMHGEDSREVDDRLDLIAAGGGGLVAWWRS